MIRKVLILVAALNPFAAYAGSPAQNIVTYTMLQSAANDAQTAPAAPASRTPDILDLSPLNMPTANAACKFDLNPSWGETHFYGEVRLKDFLGLANEAEILTDQGRKTDKISPDALKMIRASATQMLRAYDGRSLIQLAPHEAITLCGISFDVLGKNIVTFR